MIGIITHLPIARAAQHLTTATDQAGRSRDVADANRGVTQGPSATAATGRVTSASDGSCAKSAHGGAAATHAPTNRPHLAGALPRICGLSSSQVANAWVIVAEGRRMGVPARGQIIAIATALQKSRLINRTHAVDHDSLGIFQQRPSTGWGTARQIETPRYAAHAFYRSLLRHSSAWDCLTCAAQAVQNSAFPRAYAKHEHLATLIVNVLSGRS